MATITNYYEELNLSSEMSIEDIDSRLTQLETVWNQRLFNEPEKANKILTIIKEARVCFADSEAKVKYDKSLSEGQSEDNEQLDNRRVNFDKWYGQAREYFDKKEYDLAKAAIEKANSYYDTSDENAAFLSYMADIYRFNEEYDQAFKFINEAIIIEPQNWEHISIKGAIHNSLRQYVEACECFKKANEIAYSLGDSVRESQSQGFLAVVLFQGLKDYASAEAAANRAVQLGDSAGLGKAMIDELNKPQKYTFEQLSAYENERCNSLEKIDSLKNEIVKRNSNLTESNTGWLLCKKYNKCSNPDDPKTSEYWFVLLTSGEFACFFSEYADQNEEFERKGAILNVVLMETDFNGYYFGTYNSGDRVGFINRNYKDYSLTRKGRKGAKLLERLQEIIDKNEKPQQIIRPRQWEYEQKMATYEAERKQRYRQQGLCQYCGGSFKGLFTKTCTNCGKQKDY